MQMNTNLKLKIARLLYRLIHLLRRASGKKNDQVTCNRSGILWNLDLQEGIDLAIYLFGRFETKTAAALSQLVKPGSVVIDIGANIGAHALPLAHQVGENGKVYAIEPTDWAYEKMIRNLELNPELKKSLIPIKAFFSDLSGTLPGQTHSSWRLNDAQKHPIHGGQLQHSGNAHYTSLDQWVQEQGVKKIDLIKLDVDGYEVKVLKGGIQTLLEFKPKMILELTLYNLDEYGDSLKELLELLKNCNYQLKTQDGRKLIPMKIEELKKIIPSQGGINAMATVISEKI
jgi:FkbM family methyltransferase